ncbi:hypothetical protein [Rhodoplanes sp. SY1]|uniref:hypothetical protein n=1 Tax=Rhodoplanes sp. SY1 TaxID=3166646 RepID=UPI0038B66581
MKQPGKRSDKPHAQLLYTLVYLDEPQVILLDHGNDAKIIAVAIERPDMVHPFFGAEISAAQWERYRREYVDLRYLFLHPRWRKWYFIDLGAADSDGNVPLKSATSEERQNESFLPSHGFFARAHTCAPEELPTAVLQTKKYSIDGSWEPSELSLFFARIYDLYSFFLGMQKFSSEETTDDQRKILIDAFGRNSLHSGFNYVHFYGDLKGLLSLDERLSMGAIVKQSPGFVDVRGVGEVLSEVSLSYTNFINNYEDLRDSYNILHKYLSSAKLLRRADARYDNNSPIAAHIKQLSEPLCSLLALEYDVIYRLTGGNHLLVAKILLSHFRRLAHYAIFFDEGRVSFSSTLHVSDIA